MAIIFPPILPGVKFGRHVVEIEGELFRFDGGRDRRPDRLIPSPGLRNILRRRHIFAGGSILLLRGIRFWFLLRGRHVGVRASVGSGGFHFRPGLFARISVFAFGGGPGLVAVHADATVPVVAVGDVRDLHQGRTASQEAGDLELSDLDAEQSDLPGDAFLVLGTKVVGRVRHIVFRSGVVRCLGVHLVASDPVEFRVGEVLADLLARATLLHDDLRRELAFRGTEIHVGLVVGHLIRSGLGMGVVRGFGFDGHVLRSVLQGFRGCGIIVGRQVCHKSVDVIASVAGDEVVDLPGDLVGRIGAADGFREAVGFSDRHGRERRGDDGAQSAFVQHGLLVVAGVRYQGVRRGVRGDDVAHGVDGVGLRDRIVISGPDAVQAFDGFLHVVACDVRSVGVCGHRRRLPHIVRLGGLGVVILRFRPFGSDVRKSAVHGLGEPSVRHVFVFGRARHVGIIMRDDVDLIVDQLSQSGFRLLLRRRRLPHDGLDVRVVGETVGHPGDEFHHRLELIRRPQGFGRYGDGVAGRVEPVLVVNHVVDQVRKPAVVHETFDSWLVSDGVFEARFEIMAADGGGFVGFADDGPQMRVGGHAVGDGVHCGERFGVASEHVLDVVAHARALRAEQGRVEALAMQPRVVDVRIFAVEAFGQFLEHAFTYDGVRRSGGRVEVMAVALGE